MAFQPLPPFEHQVLHPGLEVPGREDKPGRVNQFFGTNTEIAVRFRKFK
jgi:hypothetical protein